MSMVRVPVSLPLANEMALAVGVALVPAQTQPAPELVEALLSHSVPPTMMARPSKLPAQLPVGKVGAE